MRGTADKLELFAERLKKAMYLKDMSVAQLAKTTGIGQSTIHRYLSGEREPIYGNLIAISRALDADLNFLTGVDCTDSGKVFAEFINKLASEVGSRLGVRVAREGPPGADPARTLGRIPVIGRISDGPNLKFTDEGHPSGEPLYVMPALGDTDLFAYGIVFEGDSMASRILDGDVTICSPDADWGSGDMVLVRRADGQMVVRVIQERESSYLLRSYNPAYALEEIRRKQVSFIHKLTSIRPRAHLRDADAGYGV